MLKTYRIIPLVLILFLFGFTLITVAPVFAQEQWNPSMGMCHNSRPCIKSNMCGSECAPHVRESKGWVKPNDTGVHSPMPTSTSPSGGEVAQLNAKISGLEAELTQLNGVVRTLQEQSNNSMQPAASNAPSGAEGRTKLGQGRRGLFETLEHKIQNGMEAELALRKNNKGIKDDKIQSITNRLDELECSIWSHNHGLGGLPTPHKYYKIEFASCMKNKEAHIRAGLKEQERVNADRAYQRKCSTGGGHAKREGCP